MSIVTTYICDRCGHEQADSSQMWNVGIGVNACKTPSYSRSNLKNVALWCRNCMEKMGLTPPSDPDKKPPAPAPTLEDLVREIVQEEIGVT